MRFPFSFLIGLTLFAPGAFPYIHGRSSANVALRRGDNAGIQYLINDRTAPGLTGSTGATIITADSDPIGALQASMNSWTNVSTATIVFAPPGTTSLDTSIADRQNIISFVDTPGNRSALGDAIAVTMLFSSGGVLADTDILFSPTLTFSTTLQTGTYDIQSVATHELGHALGSSHSGLLAATMFYAVRPGSNLLATLSADDIAFATDTYPKTGSVESLGTISGSVKLAGGTPVFGALVTAVDPNSGVGVGTITNTDGTYSIARVPPGRYFVYTEPMDGPVAPDQLSSVYRSASVDFSTTVFGGVATPQAVDLGSGGSANVDLTVDSGTPAINIQGGGAGPSGSSFGLFGGAAALTAGQTADFVVFGRGLDDTTITESTISFLGAPITIVKGTLRRGRTSPSNLPLIAFTVQVASSAPQGVATLLVRSASGAAAVYSAGVKLAGGGAATPVFSSAGVVNAASFLSGPVAAGEIISIFGTGLGPASGVIGGLDGSGKLASSLAGVRVTFDGTPAPLFYVQQGQINAQAPYEISGQSSANVVVTYQSVSSAAVSVPVTVTRPGIFVLPGSTQGIALNLDGSLTDTSNPAARGSAITVYATGQGAIQPSLGTGALAPLAGPLSSAVQTPSATIGGRPATVLFAGMTPGFAGLLQVNVEVPADAPTGPSIPLVVSFGGVGSQANVTVAVR